ncbi:DODA-type extradiol aromatic ring-opening family dioxygenase [Geomonas azotofigens]|uniref:DODA-type extradiol aromatic ring-opening family dioxygenase n=1 Tax=Geomonas azotofigens TaxID=2843196 RepID=UPI001C10BC9D|nr:class III extradiol ring-cleavage dioxygenase [Geomonas azotofigens]MBU5611662.1 dioxygenase [Geomonas azotofigens]
MSARFPAVFVSHGSPSMVLEQCPTRDFLLGLGRDLGRPKGIVAVTAHWNTATARVSGHLQPPTIHDFGGFAEELYQLGYPAPGDPVLAKRVLSLLHASGIEGERDLSRGFDHGTWAPLMLIYPDADIPVVQLSVQPQLGARHHLALGEALRPLRDEGVLILASGSATHNLRDFFGRALDDEPLPYAKEFASWLREAVVQGRVDDLLAWQERAPHALRNHPTPEHFLPLLVALGTGGPGSMLHDGFTYGALSMAAFRWD